MSTLTAVKPQQNERRVTIARAMAEAVAQEMRIDPRVFVMGEEVGYYQGAYKVTEGLLDRFGAARVIDAPIAMAAPIARPAKPASAMGVSTTRSGPNSSSSPRVTLYAPW